MDGIEEEDQKRKTSVVSLVVQSTEILHQRNMVSAICILSSQRQDFCFVEKKIGG